MSPCIDLTSEQRYIFCTTPSHPNTIQTSLAQALCSGPLGLGYCNAFLCVRLHNAVGGIQPPRAPSCSISLCENVVVETWCALVCVCVFARCHRCTCDAAQLVLAGDMEGSLDDKRQHSTSVLVHRVRDWTEWNTEKYGGGGVAPARAQRRQIPPLAGGSQERFVDQRRYANISRCACFRVVTPALLAAYLPVCVSYRQYLLCFVGEMGQVAPGPSCGRSVLVCDVIQLHHAQLKALSTCLVFVCFAHSLAHELVWSCRYIRYIRCAKYEKDVNLVRVAVHTKNQDPNAPVLGLFAVRNIKQGTELLRSR